MRANKSWLGQGSQVEPTHLTEQCGRDLFSVDNMNLVAGLVLHNRPLANDSDPPRFTSLFYLMDLLSFKKSHFTKQQGGDQVWWTLNFPVSGISSSSIFK